MILATLPIFVIGAIYLNWNQGPFNFNGPLPFVKALIWISVVLFTAYSRWSPLFST